MILAQITDTHVSEPGAPLYDRGRTHERLREAVAHLNGLDPAADLVLVTGDLVDRTSVAEYEIFREIIADLEAPTYLLPGNHDNRDNLRQVFPDHGYLGSSGFMQYSLEDWPLRIIALDTLRTGWPSGRLCEERLNWLQEKLDQAPARPTLIAMHHPPFRTGLNAMDKMGLDGVEELAQLLRGYDNIEAVICGHLHREITHRFANTIAMTAPSTAHQIYLNLRRGDDIAVTQEPAACMLHVWFGGDDGLVSHITYVGDKFETTPVELGADTKAKMAERSGE